MSEHEPSGLAMRAAEAIHHQQEAAHILKPDQLAEIIERETGAGEAMRLIQNFMSVCEAIDCIDFMPAAMPVAYDEARAFIGRFKED